MEMADKLQRAGLRALCQNEAFQKWLWTILADANIFSPTHVPGHPDTSAHAEGRRALGLQILHKLNAAEPDILPMLWRAGNLLERDVVQAQQQEELSPDVDYQDEP